MLKFEEATLYFKGSHRPALKKIDLQVNPGDFLVIVGGNGSGKSSLLKLIQGLYTPSKGKISLHGKALSDFSLQALAYSICTLTQDLSESTFGTLSVFENCLLADRDSNAFHGCKQSVASYLATFSESLSHHADLSVSRLSGGQRQTLALAMALIHPPQILLLDEHTSALDPKMAHQLLEKTRLIIEERKITTLMVTHELNDALKMGNRLIALKEGSILFEAEGEAKEKLTKEDLLHLCY